MPTTTFSNPLEFRNDSALGVPGMARYIERAENAARMLDIILTALLLLQTPEQEARAQRSVLRISELEAAFAQRYDEPTREHANEGQASE